MNEKSRDVLIDQLDRSHIPEVVANQNAIAYALDRMSCVRKPLLQMDQLQRFH